MSKLRAVGVPCVEIGKTGGDTIAIEGEAPVSIASLKEGFEGWLPNYMAGQD